MPSDLTGTPTTLGIGTYNTSVDAPSGLGFNEAMAQIDALITARMAAPASPVDKGAMVWHAATSTWIPATGGDGSGNHFLADDGTYKSVSASTYRKSTAKAVNTTVAATDLLNGEITVAAGALGTTGVLRLTAIGDFVQNAASAVAPPRFQVILGGTTLLDTGVSGTTGQSAGRGSWKAEIEIANTGSASAQVSSLDLSLFSSAGSFGATRINNAFTTGQGFYSQFTDGSNNVFYAAKGINPATAVDTSSAKLLQLMVINGTSSAAYETRLLSALAEVI